MKTEEKLNALKEKVEAPNAKLNALTKEELAQVTGGIGRHGCFPGDLCVNCGVEMIDYEPDPDDGTSRTICPKCGEIYHYSYGYFYLS